MNELRQALYLIADEMRGMATLGRTFAGNIYETERAHRMMALAAQVAALAEGEPMAEVRALFEAEPWHRASPMLGVNAVVLDSEGRVLLIQRKDNEHWDRTDRHGGKRLVFPAVRERSHHTYGQ